MKTYLADIIPKIKRFSEKLDDITLLTNQHWVVIDEMVNAKNVYIFRNNQELLISQNGKVEKAKWEYLGNNALLIDRKNESYLFRHGFFDQNILALKIDGKEEYAFLVNENKFGKELNSAEDVIEFLSLKYLNPQIKKSIQSAVGVTDENSSSITTITYQPPKYTVEKVSEHASLFGGAYSKYSVKFEDDIKCEVFVQHTSKQAYFKHYGSIHYYVDIDACVTAIHYFIKTRKLFKEGFIESFS